MEQTKIENKRIKHRRNLYYYLKVIDVETDEMLGKIVDLTTGGMMLVSDSSMEIGVVKKAKIILDNNLFNLLPNSLNVIFTTQWSKPDVNPENFVTGVKFVDLSDKDSATIDQIIRKIGFNE
jgi:hypothetical protein